MQYILMSSAIFSSRMRLMKETAIPADVSRRMNTVMNQPSGIRKATSAERAMTTAVTPRRTAACFHHNLLNNRGLISLESSFSSKIASGADDEYGSMRRMSLIPKARSMVM